MENEFNPLEVNMFNTQFPNPIILGSGTLVERYEQIDPFLNAGIGAVIPRTTRKELIRTVHPSPHLYQTGRRGNEIMLNAEWTGADINYWREYLERMSNTRQILMSVSGRDIDGCVEVVKEIDNYSFPMIEINISCAHSNNVHGFITRNSEHISTLIKTIKDKGINTPLALKLGHSDFIVELANVAKESGIDAIVAINTYGPVFDFRINENGVPESVLGIDQSKGGMSGSSIFNIALTDTAEIVRNLGIPVIGCGGVRTAEDVIKMIMAGASAVQIYTAAHIKGQNAPSFFSDLHKKLRQYLHLKNITSIKSCQGLAQSLLTQETNLIPKIPEVIGDNCTGCDLCIPVCLPEAITIEPYPNKAEHIIGINDSCIGCGHCVSICPSNALTIK